MKTPRTTVRADAKLQNMPEETLDELWMLRHPEEEGGRVWTLTEIAAWIPSRFGFSAAVSAVGNFYQWLELKRRMDARAALADQLKLDLAKDPNFSNDHIKSAGQKLFMAEGIVARQPKVFLAAVESTQNDARLAQQEERLRLMKSAGARDERKLALLEAAAREAKAKLDAITTAAKSQGGLTPETLAAIEEAASLL